jgi:hypothetical protein
MLTLLRRLLFQWNQLTAHRYWWKCENPNIPWHSLTRTDDEPMWVRRWTEIGWEYREATDEEAADIEWFYAIR